MIGFGAVGRALLFMLIRIIKKINIVNVIEKNDIPQDLLNFYESYNINFIKREINMDNCEEILNSVNKNDIIIDCSYGVSTKSILEICQNKGCAYINSCIEEWAESENQFGCKRTLYKQKIKSMKEGKLECESLYHRHKVLEKLAKQNKHKKYNAIISMGCNPGNVSIWTKIALDKINEQYNLKFDSYADLAHKLGVQTIHISERDQQRNSVPKKKNEYCNTWSTNGEVYYEETLGFPEGSLGTHEKMKSDKNYFMFDIQAIYTKAQSYTPLTGRFIGNMTPHEESYTIGRELTIKKDDVIIYRPSVYFVYHPTNDTMISAEELLERNLEYQTNYRLLTKEIIDGSDELGVTIFLENGSVYWIGSLLYIKTARGIYENIFDNYINATLVQVISGYLSGIVYMIDLINKNEYKGMMYADDLPHKELFEFSRAFLGEFVFEKVDDFKLFKYDKSYDGNISEVKGWYINNFIIK